MSSKLSPSTFLENLSARVPGQRRVQTPKKQEHGWHKPQIWAYMHSFLTELVHLSIYYHPFLSEDVGEICENVAAACVTP